MNTPLNCQELVEVVTAYLDGALMADERRTVDDHLAECQDCVRHIEQVVRAIEITGRLAGDEDGSAADLDTLLIAFRSSAPTD